LGDLILGGSVRVGEIIAVDWRREDSWDAVSELVRVLEASMRGIKPAMVPVDSMVMAEPIMVLSPV
jgi:hypothetical protein